jgi:hypothetical protein
LTAAPGTGQQTSAVGAIELKLHSSKEGVGLMRLPLKPWMTMLSTGPWSRACIHSGTLRTRCIVYRAKRIVQHRFVAVGGCADQHRIRPIPGVNCTLLLTVGYARHLALMCIRGYRCTHSARVLTLRTSRLQLKSPFSGRIGQEGALIWIRCSNHSDSSCRQ